MKKLFVGLLGFIIIIILATVYFYNKPSKNIANSESDLSISANELFNEFATNEPQANSRFIDKIIEVKGVVREISYDNESPSILLNTDDETFGVLCSFGKPINDKNIKKGDSVVVKGLCTGMLTDVVLIKCSI